MISRANSYYTILEEIDVTGMYAVQLPGLAGQWRPCRYIMC